MDREEVEPSSAASWPHPRPRRAGRRAAGRGAAPQPRPGAEEPRPPAPAPARNTHTRGALRGPVAAATPPGPPGKAAARGGAGRPETLREPGGSDCPRGLHWREGGSLRRPSCFTASAPSSFGVTCALWRRRLPAPTPTGPPLSLSPLSLCRELAGLAAPDPTREGTGRGWGRRAGRQPH